MLPVANTNIFVKARWTKIKTVCDLTEPKKNLENSGKICDYDYIVVKML